MSLIAWKDEFSLGIVSVDFEHQEIIELINNLDAAMQADTSYENVVDGLGEIYAQISSHFALEEKIMRDAGYDGYDAHKDDHERLLDVLLDVMDSVDADGVYDRDALSKELDSWFSDHFRTQDAMLHRKLG